MNEHEIPGVGWYAPKKRRLRSFLEAVIGVAAIAFFTYALIVLAAASFGIK